MTEIIAKRKEISVNSFSFSEAHQTLITLECEDALNFVLNHEHSRELVHSFSDESFYFFLYNIGIKKAGPIIALASRSQWEYFLDIEIWNKDSLDYFSLTNILILMMSANPREFTEWCFYEKFQMIEFYLFRNIRIRIVNNDDDFYNLEDGFFTNDGVFYIKHLDYNTISEGEQHFLNERKMMIDELLRYFAKMDHFRYQTLLMEVIGVTSAEVQEELFRLRNVRLAEKGFLPFHEAVGVYQPIQFKKIKMKGKKILKKHKNDLYPYALSYFHVDVFEHENLFIRALRNIEDEEIIEQLQTEFASLCNLLVTADNKKISNYDDLKKVVLRASSFLSIGIELIMLDVLKNNIMFARDIIQTWVFADIFRLGYGKVLALNRKTLKWYKNSWFDKHGLKLHFWGEALMCVIGGLLLERPMFFDGIDCKHIYRDFEVFKEIEESEKIIDQVISIDNMLNSFNIDLLPSYDGSFTNINNLLLTMWARHVLGIDIKKIYFAPIDFKNFKIFYNALWEEYDNGRRIKNVKKTEFLIWIACKMKTEPFMIAENLREFFKKLFQVLEEEFLHVNNEYLDPRYINLFIIDV